MLAARSGRSVPIGSISQLGEIELDDGTLVPVRDTVPLAGLDDLVFGGWDPISSNALEAARTAGVLTEADLGPLSGELEAITAMEAVFDQDWVRRLEGRRVKAVTSGTRHSLVGWIGGPHFR